MHLSIDISWVNSILFFYSILENISLWSSTLIPNRKVPTLWDYLKATIKLHTDNGYNITQVDTDLERNFIKDELSFLVNIIDTNDHVH